MNSERLRELVDRYHPGIAVEDEVAELDAALRETSTSPQHGSKRISMTKPSLQSRRDSAARRSRDDSRFERPAPWPRWYVWQFSLPVWWVGEAPKLRPLDHGNVRLIQDGFKKADTPAWLPKQTGKKESPFLLFTDLELEKLYRFMPPSSVDEVRSGASRGKAASDERFYGMFDGKLALWRPGEEPEVIVETVPGGREISLNDIVVTSRGRIYFTTLKDPDKGRLSVVDPQTRKVTVLFDGEDEPTLLNPNGIAIDPDERFLYVGISSYQNRKHSAVYCFPILADGTIDVETGKAKPWAAVKAPDGIAVHRNRDVYFTAGNKVEVFDSYGRRRGQIKIPKGSGTNLCLGGDRGETLYVTTWNALYSVEIGK